VDGRSKTWMQAAALAAAPIVAMAPVVRMAGFGSAGFSTIWPILCYMPLAMWMESRSLTMVLATCRSRRDPFLIAALPLGVTAVTVYVFCAAVFAFALPALLHLLL